MIVLRLNLSLRRRLQLRQFIIQLTTTAGRASKDLIHCHRRRRRLIIIDADRAGRMKRIGGGSLRLAVAGRSELGREVVGDA